MTFARLAWAFALLTAVGSEGDSPSGPDDGILASDERFLAEARVDASAAGLIDFFRARSPTESDRRTFERLVSDLGDEEFAVRDRASRRLTERGAAALPALRAALSDPDPEVVRRAHFCIEEIERGPGPALTAAAVRVLRQRQPAGAVEALLGYLPFNDDDGVEDEALEALVTLGVHEGHADAVLAAALADPRPARRAAAAYVVGRLDDPARRAVARSLLADPDSRVRLRAAQGLAAARERAVFPTLVALLGEAPTPIAWQAEELLRRLAGPSSPIASVGEGEPASRAACRAAWEDWWKRGGRIDWEAGRDAQRLLGLTVVAEMDRNRVWECGPDGKARWTIEGLQEPMDAHVLPSGRVLVAEYLGQRVSERDLHGNVLWQRQLDDHPIACQRLANGNTFVVSYQSLAEYTRDGREIFRHCPGAGYFIFGAHKLRNGHLVYVSGHGMLTELDAMGREIRSFPVARQGGWCSVEGLPNGNFLVAVAGQNRLAEFDGAGKEVWECDSVPSPYSASRLPNGNTLVVSMSRQRLVEVDRTGKKVWERPTEGRPFHAHRR